MENMKQLRVGAGKALMKFPEDYFPQEGFGGVHDDIHVRALVIEQEEKAAIVAAELPSLKPYSLIEEFQKYINGITGIPKSNIWICVTHNVSAPHVPPHNQKADGKSLEKKALHLKIVEEAMEKAVCQAINNMQEAVIAAACGQADINRNRDIFTNQGWWLGISETGYSDKTLSLICFNSLKGELIGALFTYGIKTAVMEDARNADGIRYVTGDLTGEACKVAEQKLKVPVIYLMGAAGDQVPKRKAQYDAADENGDRITIYRYEEGFEWIKELGKGLGEKVIETVELAGKGKKCRKFEAMRTSFVFPGQKGYPRDMPYEPILSYQYLPDEKQEVDMEILRFDDVVLLGIKPEVTSIIGTVIRKKSPFLYTLLAAMVNGGMNYMAHKEEYDRLAFEGTHSVLARGSAEDFAKKAVEFLNTIKIRKEE